MTIRIDELMNTVDAADVMRLAEHVGLNPGPGDTPEQEIWVRGVAPGLVRIGESQRTYHLPAEGEDLAYALALADAQRNPGGGNVIVVTGASGGLGATTFAATLAATAQSSGESVALVEGDRAAGALESMLALPYGEGLRWQDVADGGPVVAHRLLEALPGWRWVSVLAGHPGEGPSPQAVVSAVNALRRSCTLVVVDLPRCFLFSEHYARLGADMMVSIVGATQESLTCAAGLAMHMRRPPEQWERWILRRSPRCEMPPWYVEETLGLYEGTLLTMGQERGLADAIAAGDRPWVSARGPLRSAAWTLLKLIDRRRAQSGNGA